MAACRSRKGTSVVGRRVGRWRQTAEVTTYQSNVGPPRSFQVVGDPWTCWRREADLNRWLAGNLSALACCLGLGRLEFAGREVTVGDQVLDMDVLGRTRWNGGLRLDIDARDERGRRVVIESQLSEADHAYMGQLIANGCAAKAELVVWVVASEDPVFCGEHLEALAELNALFGERRAFRIVALTLESVPRPAPAPDDPLNPVLRLIDPVTALAGPAVIAPF